MSENLSAAGFQAQLDGATEATDLKGLVVAIISALAAQEKALADKQTEYQAIILVLDETKAELDRVRADFAGCYKAYNELKLQPVATVETILHADENVMQLTSGKHVRIKFGIRHPETNTTFSVKDLLQDEALVEELLELGSGAVEEIENLQEEEPK